MAAAIKTSWTRSEGFKAGLLSLLLLVLLLGIWHLATTGGAPAATPAAATTLTAEEIEYAKLMGRDATTGTAPPRSGFPTLGQMAEVMVAHLSAPFHYSGPNDMGIGLQLAHSLGRVAAGFLLAAAVAIPLGFLIGMSPLAWMPLALYTIKDSSLSGVFVIFICSIWPMLLNTAFGVASVRRDWLNVARTLEVSPLRKAFLVILPAAAPTIVTGMRISMGIAWLVIVAAEMLVGGTGIGHFVWNEWNNLSLPNIIFAILCIGVVGMLLDRLFAMAQRAVTYVE